MLRAMVRSMVRAVVGEGIVDCVVCVGGGGVDGRSWSFDGGLSWGV